MIFLFFVAAVQKARTSGDGDKDTGNSLWLLGPVCGVVALIIIISVVCIIWRRLAKYFCIKSFSTFLGHYICVLIKLNQKWLINPFPGTSCLRL
jgi:hypothetical protein